MEAAIVTAGKLIGAGLAAIGMAGTGAGIGVVFAGYLVAVARQPSMQSSLFGSTILGFAFSEAIALFALMIVMLILFVF